jgi:amidohydrolase
MPDAFDGLLDEARALLPEMVALRRRIHENPELGLVLPDTQKAVLEALAPLELEVATGGRTSAVVATLRGGRAPAADAGPTLLLRADMDALPMPEHTGLPYASRHEGRMHACGHDAHVAMLVGAARLLARRRAALPGIVKLLFQPGEEGFAGARILIEEGLLDAAPRVEAAFAIHVDSSLASGRLALGPGPIMAAADVISIELEGRGGHASMPHLALDPIPAACEIVLALQSFVTRRIDVFDPVVITVTRVQAGSAANVVPASASLLGTIRSTSERSRAAAHEGVRRVAQGVAAAHGLEARVHVVPGYPVTVNDAGFAAFAREVAGELLGAPALVDMPAPVMGAEDFSYLLQRVPGAIVFLGARPPGQRGEPLHSSRMVLDEEAMAQGAALHAAIALRWLASRARAA